MYPCSMYAPCYHTTAYWSENLPNTTFALHTAAHHGKVPAHANAIDLTFPCLRVQLWSPSRYAIMLHERGAADAAAR